MSREDPAPPKAAAGIDLTLRPAISLIGELGEASIDIVRDGLDAAADGTGPVVVEVTTLGGDAEMARRIVLEFDLARPRFRDRRLVFLGKTVVYSAGITVMSAFPTADRLLTSDAMLLIHVRQLEKTLQLQGPMRNSLPQVEALVHQIRTGMALERDNFTRLIRGSAVTLDDLLERAQHNWYIPAAQAVSLGLVAAIV